MKTYTYEYDQVFTDIPDSDQVLLTIPDEIIEQNGWKPGDHLHVVVDDGVLVLRKIDNG